MTQVVNEAAMARDRGCTPRWPYLLARISTASLAARALAQIAFAAEFLNGHFPALRSHAVTATALMAAAVLQVVVVVFVRGAAGPLWLIPVGAAVVLLLFGERALGETRLIGVHVPAGVLLGAVIWQLNASVWRTPLPLRAQADVADSAWESSSASPTRPAPNCFTATTLSAKTRP